MPRRDPYALLARVYDQPDHEEITRSFLARARPLIDGRPRGTHVLDLACGTGVMAELLGRRNVPVVGVDRARAMLDVARRRCGGLACRFVEGDLTSFHVREPCSVATACGDVMNHLPTTSLLERVFQRIHDELEPGGVLLFESLRRYCFEAYWDRAYHLEGAGGDLTMECDWDPRRDVGTARMIGYAKEADGSYTKFETTLVEHFHSERTLTRALRSAGFVSIEHELWSPWDDQHLEPEMDRHFWTVTRS